MKLRRAFLYSLFAILYSAAAAIAAAPGKLVGGTHPAAVRNVYAPLAGHCINLYAVSEGSGNALTNLGLGTTYQATFAAWGNAVLTNPTWLTDADGAPYLQISTTAGGKCQMYATASSYARGTGLLVFQEESASGTQRTLFTSGRAAASIGALLARREVDDSLSLTMVASGSVTKILTFAGVDWTKSHTLLWEWGESTFTAYLDTYTNVQSDATTIGWQIDATRSFWIGGGITGTASGIFDLYLFGLWDFYPEPLDIQELLADPYLVVRPPPATTEFLMQSGPIAGCPTAAGCTVRFQTGSGTAGNLASAANAVKLEYGASIAALAAGGTFTAATTVPAQTYLRNALDVTLPLTAGVVTWYRPWWTIDGATWYPSPGGHYRAVGQRSAAGGACGVFADTHMSSALPVTMGFGVELWGSGPTGGSAAEYSYATWRCTHDYWHLLAGQSGEPEFTLQLGDWLLAQNYCSGTGDLSTGLHTAGCRCLDFLYLLWKKCPAYFVVGNRDGEAGYVQNAIAATNDVAAQKQATIVRKRLIPNPTNSTYPEGGENEGTPTVANALSWLPVLDSLDNGGSGPGVFDAAYRTAYVLDAGSENASPLGNYYGFTWGGHLFTLLDPLRYAEPGDPAAALGTGGLLTDRGDFTWQLGAAQWTWLESTLSASTATWRSSGLHQLLAGEFLDGTHYARGSGVRLGANSGEEGRLAADLAASGSELLLHGHDHCAATVRRELDIFTVGATGYRFAGNTASYGTVQSEGRDTTAWGDGLGTALGIVHSYAGRGYGYLSWDATTLTYKLRQAALEYDGAAVQIDKERYLSAPVACATLAITLSERPRDVGFIAADSTDFSDGTDWWTTPPTDYTNTAAVGYAADEYWSTATITAVAGTGDGDYRVLAVPRWLYTTTVLPRAATWRPPGIQLTP